MLTEWKRRHGRVFRVAIGGRDYVFRPLTVGEFRRVSLIESREERESLVLAAVLDPPDQGLQLPSGAAETLINLILAKTDISEDSIIQKIGEARDRLGLEDHLLQWKILIIRYLNYTPDEVDAMGIDKFMESVALLESNGLAGQTVVAAGREEGAGPAPAAPEGVDPNDLMAVYRRGKERFYGGSRPLRKSSQ